MKKPKSFKNCKINSSFPHKNAISFSVLPSITGDLQQNALLLLSPKKSIKSHKKSQSIFGEIIILILKPNNFQTNQETRMTDPYVLISFLNPSGIFSRMFNHKTKKEFKKSSQLLDLKYQKIPEKPTIIFWSGKF